MKALPAYVDKSQFDIFDSFDTIFSTYLKRTIYDDMHIEIHQSIFCPLEFHALEASAVRMYYRPYPIRQNRSRSRHIRIHPIRFGQKSGFSKISYLRTLPHFIMSFIFRFSFNYR